MADTDAYDPYADIGFDDLVKQREKTAQQPSQPIPGIAHGSIPGIRGVDTGSVDPSSGQLLPAGKPEDDAGARIGTWLRNRGVVDRWNHIWGNDKVQQDPNALSASPTRTDTGPNTPMNGGLPPTPFGPGMSLPNGMGQTQPTKPFPAPPPQATPPAAPTGPAPAPSDLNPSPMGPASSFQQPHPAATPAAHAEATTPPELDHSIIPKDSLLGRIFNGTWGKENKLTLLAMAGGLAGSQSWGQGIGRAFQAAVPAQQADIANNNQNMTAGLLMQKMPGLTQDQALAMARNPTIMAQITPQLFGAKQKKFTVIGENSVTGQKNYGFVDEVTGKVYDMSGNEIRGGAGGGVPGMEETPANYDPQTGRDEAYLNSLNKVDPTGTARSAVEAILRGDASVAGRNMQKYLPMATRAEQGFSQQVYDERKRTMADFAPQGTSGKNLTAINTGLNHLNRLSDMVDQLGKFNYTYGAGLLNPGMNAIRGEASPEYQEFRGHWNAAVTGVAGELAKVFRTTGMSERDIDEWKKSFSINSSPAEAKAAIQEAMHLIDGRLDAIGESYNKGMRLSSAKPSLELLSPQARAIHEKIGGAGAPETRVGVTSQTVPPPAERKKDEVYVTPKGPMIWKGNGWAPAR